MPVIKPHFFTVPRKDELNFLSPRKNVGDGYEGLNKKDLIAAGWAKEIKILKSLEKNFVNKPEIEHYPFPKLIDANEEELELKLSFCGEDLSNLTICRERYWVEEHIAHTRGDKNWLIKKRSLNLNPSFKPKNIANTFDCIINNLALSKVAYPDIHDNFGNLCVNEEGHLHLIDFGPPADIECEQGAGVNWRTYRQTLFGSSPGDMSKGKVHYKITDQRKLKEKIEKEFSFSRTKLLSVFGNEMD